MKSIKYMLIILFLNTLFISCTNTDTEDLQLVKKDQVHFADDNQNDPQPPRPPLPPG